MAWYSILPAHLTAIETWVIRFSLLLALVNIAPWIIAILYDFVLYVARRIWHEIPIWGGRARGDTRPRADSLRERVRRLSIAEIIGTNSAARSREDTRAELRRRGNENGKMGHVRVSSWESIEEENEEEGDKT